MKKLFSTLPVIKGERVTLKPLTADDKDALREMTQSEQVYRYLPTFLYEKKYEDNAYVIEHLYDECLQTSLILGVFMDGSFCGLAEIYGYQAQLKKVSVGYRLCERYWGKGIATETLGLMVQYLLEETDIRIITASTMAQNKSSDHVLKKNGFKRIGYTVLENWGYAKPILTEKWIRTRAGEHGSLRSPH